MTRIVKTALIAFSAVCFLTDFGFAQSAPGKIAMKARVEGNDDIFVMNSDGTAIVNLTKNPAEDRNPWWSPDGKRIYFETNRDGNFQFYSMAADGTDVRPVAPSKSEDKYQALSPDGKLVAMMVIDDGRIGLFTMRSDGTKRRSIARGLPAKEGTYYHFPRISFDGSKIAFASNRDTRLRRTRSGDPGLEIYVANIDGSKARRITFNEAEDSLPYFSPDGKHLLFGSSRTGKYHLYRMTLDGRNATPITWGDHSNWSARYSNDGSRIIFVSNRDGETAIYSMKPDGSDLKRLTTGLKSVGSPALYVETK